MKIYIVLGGKNGDYVRYVGPREKVAQECAQTSRFTAKIEVWENETHLSHRDRIYTK